MSNIMQLKNHFIVFCFLAIIIGIMPVSAQNKVVLSRNEALRLSALPLKCLQQEYPNKLSQTLADSNELASPYELHPAFYGCFDWHSSVHGHWMLIKLLKMFPDIETSDIIRAKLLENITAENIAVETSYFSRKHEKSWERTYGWAWLLKLAEEIHTWNEPLADSLKENLMPLTNTIVELYIDFLPKLNYPIRVGEHSNTAFGLSFAWDFANTVGNVELRNLIEETARRFFTNDANCPLSWEPSGFDFLSPCLEEADLMSRILTTGEFEAWLKQFLPQLSNPDYRLETARVSDRSDGKLVHLDGLNFSRARCLNKIAKVLPEYAHLENMAYKHIKASLNAIVDDNYEGEHWLASFALLAFISFEN